MTLNFARAGELLQAFGLQELFTELLGWDHPGIQELHFNADDVELLATPIAQKRGVIVFECRQDDGGFPSYELRQRVEQRIRKDFHEHLLVFVDSGHQRQTWQWVRRTQGQSPRFREYHFFAGQSGEALLQRLEPITFSLEQEEFLTLTDVTAPLKRSFDKEQVTRRFYEEFRIEHGAFVEAIVGIQPTSDRSWYGSVMLNRLMFLYFIQKKQFLNGEEDYLACRLAQFAGAEPDAATYYLGFLLPLFHSALARKPTSVDSLVGRVPYLNGGMFGIHHLEADYPRLDIPNGAFSRLFEFFDRYQWHLDDRPLSDGSEINPDVLGYIFEKYVNQHEMGAYYTKEDVTDYMSRNCLVASLVGRLEERTWAQREMRRLIAANPAAYAVIKPDQVDQGSPAADALTTSIQVASSDLDDLTDVIGRSFDLWECLLDVARGSESPDFVADLYASLVHLRVLDPTCGSGAFLLACMDIIRGGYEVCLDRMQAFAHEGLSGSDRAQAVIRGALEQVVRHHSRDYFVVKSVAVNNLFGVDIMEEAVEIARLRLFLCLVSTAGAFEDLEPLPDIDFNLRTGNTLYGYASECEVEEALSRKLDLFDAAGQVRKDLATVDHLSRRFSELQTVDPTAAAGLKPQLAEALASLEARMNRYLAEEAGVDAGAAEDFARWDSENRPFHWFVAFHSTMHSGGFDVVVGNPPYVGYSAAKQPYMMSELATRRCGNLYAPVFERSMQVLRPGGFIGLVVPLSITFSSDMAALRGYLGEHARFAHLSSYDNIPDRIFTGVKESTNTSQANQQRVTIVLAEKGQGPCRLKTTPLLRWRASERDALFSCLPTVEHARALSASSIPKIGLDWERRFLDAWQASGPQLAVKMLRTGGQTLVVPKTAGYYVAAYPAEFDRSKQHTLRFVDAESRDLAFLLLNSNVFFWLWRVFGDGFDVTAGVIAACPTPAQGLDAAGVLLVDELRDALAACTVYKRYRGVDVPNVNFNLRLDLLAKVDSWIVSRIGVEVPPDGFLWSKSNSFFALQVPKSSLDSRVGSQAGLPSLRATQSTRRTRSSIDGTSIPPVSPS